MRRSNPASAICRHRAASSGPCPRITRSHAGKSDAIAAKARIRRSIPFLRVQPSDGDDSKPLLVVGAVRNGRVGNLRYRIGDDGNAFPQCVGQAVAGSFPSARRSMPHPDTAGGAIRRARVRHRWKRGSSRSDTTTRHPVPRAARRVRTLVISMNDEDGSRLALADEAAKRADRPDRRRQPSRRSTCREAFRAQSARPFRKP